MTYRDDLEAAQARIRTLEAELEAERERRQAAEAARRAAEAARDELKLKGASPAAGSRRRVVLWVAVVIGVVVLAGIGIMLTTGVPDQVDPWRPPELADPAFGQLTVFSTPPAYVYVDGQQIGRTPLHDWTAITVGEHHLKLEEPGYRTVTRRLYVTATEPMTLTIKLDKK